MSRKLPKADVEYYATAKPRTQEEPGYFKDGQLIQRRIYRAFLGKKSVGYAAGFPTYVRDAGAYVCRRDALLGAKKFQEKMREFLAKGEFTE
jgi:hypothetical protein